MKQELRGFSKVFAFTFTHHVGKKSYRVTLLTVALLCLLVPALVMTGMEYFSDDGGMTPEAAGTADGSAYEEGTAWDAGDVGSPSALAAVEQVFVVEQFADGKLQSDAVQRAAKGFTATGLQAFAATEAGTGLAEMDFVEYGSDLEGARQAASGQDDTLLLLVEQQASEFVLHVLLPDDSRLDEDAAYGLSAVLDTYGADWTAAVNQAAAGEAGLMDGDEEHEGILSDVDGIKMVLGYVIPYLNIMVLYFFVLFYGQGVTQSVIMEKTSKLMDVFLLSVRPGAMILGKITAVCLAGVIELTAWILCLWGGFALGKAGALALNPESDLLLVQVMNLFGGRLDGMFSVAGIIVALLLMVAGMLLYCAIAGLGGAIAGKPEDLSSANILFTLILLASFFANLLGGGLDGVESGSPWLDWIPFTSIMITPARVMLGSVSLLKGLACLAIVLVTAVLFTLLAGRVYRAMALYKGKVPGPKQIVALLREER